MIGLPLMKKLYVSFLLSLGKPKLVYQVIDLWLDKKADTPRNFKGRRAFASDLSGEQLRGELKAGIIRSRGANSASHRENHAPSLGKI